MNTTNEYGHNQCDSLQESLTHALESIDAVLVRQILANIDLGYAEVADANIDEALSQTLSMSADVSPMRPTPTDLSSRGFF